SPGAPREIEEDDQDPEAVERRRESVDPRGVAPRHPLREHTVQVDQQGMVRIRAGGIRRRELRVPEERPEYPEAQRVAGCLGKARAVEALMAPLPPTGDPREAEKEPEGEEG